MTCALCGLLGAFVGKWKSPTPAVTDAATTVKAPNSSPSALVPTVKPPPFTSAIASMDWVRAQMEKGDTTAAERLFWKDAGLTDEQRLDLAKVLVSNFRRMDPRVVARILLGLPSGNGLLWQFFSQWSGSDAEGALLFIEALPADRLNTVGVLQSSAFGLAGLPAERVTSFAAILNDEGRSYLAEGLVQFADQVGSWRNTSAILSKLNTQPQKGSLSAEWALGTRLAEIDPQAIQSQIAAETNPAKQAEMLGGYAWVTGIHDPSRGLELDAQIQNREVREDHAGHHVKHWLQSDRAAALAWLRSDAARQLMDAEQRCKLLNLYSKEVAP